MVRGASTGRTKKTMVTFCAGLLLCTGGRSPAASTGRSAIGVKAQEGLRSFLDPTASNHLPQGLSWIDVSSREPSD